MDALDLEAVACRECGLGTAGTEEERGAQRMGGSREADLAEAGETSEESGHSWVSHSLGWVAG